MTITPVDHDQTMAARVSAPGIRKPAPLLTSLKRGALQEMFEDAWYAMMKNIADINRDIGGKRKIIIELEFEVDDDDRQQVNLGIQLKQILANPNKVRSMVYVEGVNSRNPHGVEVGSID